MRTSVTSIRIAFAAMFLLGGALAEDDVTLISTEATDEQTRESYDADAEAEFLEQLHYSHEDFLRIYASLPRDEDRKVDWQRALEGGLIEPAATIDGSTAEELIMDFRVVIKFDDMLIKDVVFSHEIHTFWLNCNSCHPKVFNPEVASNRMTMKEIREGKYCGLCHGMVAFPTNIVDAPNFRANCLRCHRAKRG